MEKVLDQKIRTKLSLAVSLRDDFANREEVIGEVKVSIQDLELKAVKNPSGYYNFLDIANDSYVLTVKSQYYLDEKIDVGLPFYTVRNPLRFDHVSSTTLRKIIPSSTTGAKTAEPGPSAGDISIYMKDITAPIIIDDIFMIEDPDLSHIEFCQIKTPLPSDPAAEPFYLTLSLRFNHTRNVPLRKMNPELVTVAEIDGGSSGAKSGDMTVSLINVTDTINVKDVFITEDANIDILQIVAPLLKITLKPNSLYPFPSGTTLIRGEVKDSTGNPISGASIKLTTDGSKTRTSSNGEFVLHFSASQGDGLVQMEVAPPRAILSKSVTGEIRRGRATFLHVIYP